MQPYDPERFKPWHPVSPSSPVRLSHRLWKQALPILANRNRGELLADICALQQMIVSLGGEEESAEIVGAIQDVGRWWP